MVPKFGEVILHLHRGRSIPATEVRLHGMSSAAVRSPIFSRTPGSGSILERAVISFRIEVVS